MRTMSVDSGAGAYVQPSGTASPPCCVSSSATRAPQTHPPPSLGGGKSTAGLFAEVCQVRASSVESEVVAGLVSAGALLAELHQDVIEQRRRTEPVEVGCQPLRAERLVHE